MGQMGSVQGMDRQRIDSGPFFITSMLLRLQHKFKKPSDRLETNSCTQATNKLCKVGGGRVGIRPNTFILHIVH